ncbi:hypothetical protein AD929_03670 [Gluconobacter potus]|uniref:Uncharacterized protein n=1 Tax=Gluconobacter potus TaxID=2724927 RepID=A0A149QY18_9PROT|nr:hypothetical protein [Gluconobacter potus]KXV02209.1 hypothetical protein AD929_03670 [Gluconobacter potus]
MTPSVLFQDLVYTALISLIFYATVIRDSRRDDERRMRKVMQMQPGDTVSAGGLLGRIVEKGTFRQPFVLDISLTETPNLVHAELRHLGVPVTEDAANADVKYTLPEPPAPERPVPEAGSPDTPTAHGPVS